jgi:tRNA-2-methylthio-N6-dimethylallyladenosine synthase
LEVKAVYIKSYGCQMNVYDSERMAEILAPLGYCTALKPDEADLIILNTCHIREKATEKVYSDLGRIKEIKDARIAAGHPLLIAVAGCTAQAEGEEIMKRAKYVDMVFGPQTYHHLPEMLAQVERRRSTGNGSGRGVLNIDFPEEVKFDHFPEISNLQGAAAFLSIQEGCDKFCHFCVVPYTRGAEYSRPAASVLKDARLLVSKGVREITLLGQNVNAYHGEAPQGKVVWGLGRLIRALAEIEGLERIRYTTSHPKDVDQELIEAHRDVKKLMPYLHLPVQSGSDKILKAMNRKHTIAEYLAILHQFREVCPDLVFSSDFIVGYPGESEEDFQATLNLVKAVHYAQAYSFKYSPRPGTPAAVMDNHISEEVKTERLERLQSLLREQQTTFNKLMIGRILPVLWEKPGRHREQLIGRSPYLQSVHAELDSSFIGSISSVKIAGATLNSLTGEHLTV